MFDRQAYKNVHTGEVVSARPTGMTGAMMEPDIEDTIVWDDWIPGTVGPDGVFRPTEGFLETESATSGDSDPLSAGDLRDGGQ